MPAQFKKTDNAANQNKLPLEKRTFQVKQENGEMLTLPALHKHWATRHIFAHYISLVTAGIHMKKDADLDAWRYAAESYREDMDFLLNCSHHKFWSHLLYEPIALSALNSFLQNATPFYLNVWTEAKQVFIVKLYEEILARVARIIVRMLSRVESADDWISKEYYNDLLYKNFLLSVPMLLDFAVAIGNASAENVSLLENCFNNLLSSVPNYKEDLKCALAHYSTAFRNIQLQTENEGIDGAVGGADSDDESMETTYDDVAFYTLDCAYTLSVLLEVCEQARSLSHDLRLGQCIASFYDNTLPYLYKNIWLVNEVARALIYINQARLQLLKAFRFIAYSHVEQILLNPEESLQPSENFIALLTECLSDQTFAIDYHNAYPVDLDVDILNQACPQLDDFKSKFVVDGYRKEAEAAALGTIGSIQLTMENAQTQATTAAAQIVEQQNQQTKKETLVNGTIKDKAPTPVRDIDAEISIMLEMLPQMGTGYLRKVLLRYNNSEEALAAILENNLPPDLATANQNEVYIPADPKDALYQQTGIQHLNVHDGDAYDVQTQDNPACIIKRGKGFPNAPKTIADVLDDKAELQQIRHRYQQYTLVSEDEDADEYQDEYDDSYDAFLESETRAVKSKELKAALANVTDTTDEEETEVEEEPVQTTEKTDQEKGNNRMNFCENPEIIRARYEAKRQAKWHNKGAGVAARSNNKQNADVVGAPKGQGQSKETQRNRENKEAHKSSRANHNRKSGAAFKRSKGMIS